MSEVMYERLYNANNEIVHCSKAIKGGDYKKYIEETEFNYTYKEGEERKYFTLKIQSSNIFYKIDIGGGESPEHYNEKMKIVDEKKYFDTIFEQWIEFHDCKAEIFYADDDIRKRPDVSCFDENGNLVFCIEILYSSQKSQNDIEKLKKLKVPITEIDIKNENRCKHIILPEILEINKQKHEFLLLQNRESKEEYINIETELEGIKNRINSDNESIEEANKQISNLNNETIEDDFFDGRYNIREIKSRIVDFKRESSADIGQIQSRINNTKEKTASLRVEIEKNIKFHKTIKRTISDIRNGTSATTEINKIRGYICWENNRSRQANTIIKRGF